MNLRPCCEWVLVVTTPSVARIGIGLSRLTRPFVYGMNALHPFPFQVEKMVLFLLIKQGQLALKLSDLGDEREAEGDAERERAELLESGRRDRLRDAYHAVGEDLLSLLRFVDLNATGLRKILKKFDKNVGYRLSDEYVATRSNHPFSQLQHIFRHVVTSIIISFPSFLPLHNL